MLFLWHKRNRDDWSAFRAKSTLKGALSPDSSCTGFRSTPIPGISTSTKSPSLSHTGGVRAAPNTTRRAGCDHVAGPQFRKCRAVLQEPWNIENEVSHPTLLHDLAVDAGC